LVEVGYILDYLRSIEIECDKIKLTSILNDLEAKDFISRDPKNPNQYTFIS